jgi:xanthine/CO dehydrogenase XdhC/CoxF family maturation factor
MTHQFQVDLTLLRFFLSNPSPLYVGLLGATKRRDLLFEKLRENGFSISSERHSRVFGPVGLDVGAEDPEEIALAIIAEIQSVFSSRPGGFMRERPSSNH